MKASEMSTVPSLQNSVWPYLQLLRPANIVTAWADVLAGSAVAGAALTFGGWTGPVPLSSLAWVVLASTGLYGGGIVFNDVFDAPVDAAERPERPIPSGRASRKGAVILGTLLFAGGIWSAAQVSMAGAALAGCIVGLATLYDAFSKSLFVVGPINMGLCRAVNLLLGMSAIPAALVPNWYLAAIPLVYIAAITGLSQGEVHGGTRLTGAVTGALVLGVIGGLAALALRPDYHLIPALPYVLLLVALVGPPLYQATRQPEPALIQRAVKFGIMALIPLNAALAAAFAGWVSGLVVLLLLPLSWGLGRLFPVT